MNWQILYKSNDNCSAQMQQCASLRECDKGFALWTIKSGIELFQSQIEAIIAFKSFYEELCNAWLAGDIKEVCIERIY